MAEHVWYNENTQALTDGLMLCDKELSTRYGAARKRGIDLFEGNHWGATEKAYIQKMYGDAIAELPVRNLYRQKVRHTAAMMTPGLPVLQFYIQNLESDPTIQGAQDALDRGMLEVFERSEYPAEAQRIIEDFENQNLAWAVMLPINEPKRLEILHIPTDRVLFDPGITRLRYLRWIAWVDLLSYEMLKSMYPDRMDTGIYKECIGSRYGGLAHINRERGGQDSLLQFVHLYALPGAVIPTGKVWGQEGVYRTFDKPTHLVIVEKRIVDEDHELPIDGDDDPVLPATHVILEADPGDITGKGLGETGLHPQKQVNNAQLAISVGFAENWLKRDIVSGAADQKFLDDLGNPSVRHVVTPSRNVSTQPLTGPVISHDLVAGMQDAISAFEEQTGRYGSLEGERIPGVRTASGLIHLTQQARTPVLARTRLFGLAIKRLGEIFVGWKRKWGEGIWLDEDGKPKLGEDGKPIDILKSISVKVELDSLNELSKQDTYNVLMGLAQAGMPVGEMLVEHAPVTQAVRERLLVNVREQVRMQKEMLEAAKQAQAGQAGMMGGMPGAPGPEAMLPPGVTTQPT